MNIEGLIGDLALILVLGAISTIIFRKLKQPIVLGYIVAGPMIPRRPPVQIGRASCRERV